MVLLNTVLPEQFKGKLVVMKNLDQLVVGGVHTRTRGSDRPCLVP